MKGDPGQSAQAKNREELERRILHGLACEWENALWVLDRGYREKMRPPLFRLADLTQQLGSWSARRREITLSRRLVMDHPWDAVRDILLHEMAHQFRDEVLQPADRADREDDGGPHGPWFRRACELLRADPKSSVRYRTLHERLEQGALDPRDKLMARIQKLMALAESGNRHEAESAMIKAHALILKYNIDFFSSRRERNFVSVFLGRPALRHPLEGYCLAHLLHDFYFVRGIWVSAYVLERGKMGRVLEVSGLPENVKIAAYVFDCVTRYILAQWTDYSRGKRLSRGRRTDFAMGIIDGFRSKLEKSRDEAGQFNRVDRADQQADQAAHFGRGASALVVLNDPLLDGYIRNRYRRVASFSRGGSSVDRTVRRDGMAAGQKLVISRGISEQIRDRRKLLPCT